MKQLNEYLSTNVKINKDSFPETPKLSDIIYFLKSNNFVEVKYNDDISVYKLLGNSAANGNKSFIWQKNQNDDEYWIRFCKAGKLSKENPIYFCRATEDGRIKSNDIGYIEYSERGTDDKKFNNYDKFVKNINEFFGW